MIPKFVHIGNFKQSSFLYVFLSDIVHYYKMVKFGNNVCVPPMR